MGEENQNELTMVTGPLPEESQPVGGSAQINGQVHH